MKGPAAWENSHGSRKARGLNHHIVYKGTMFPSRRASRLVPLLVLAQLLAWAGHANDDATPAPIRYPDTHDPPPGALIAEIPFEEDSQVTRIAINLAPEGNRPFVMELDTGASDSMMTAEMAKKMGINIRALKSTPYRRRTRLGRDLLFRIDSGSSDRASKSGWSVGLLGARFLAHYLVELDYPGRMVRFYNPKKYKLPKKVTAPNERIVKLKRGGTRLGVEVEVDGKSILTLLDTGAPSPLLLSGKAARKVGIEIDSLEAIGDIGTLYGTTEARLYETEDFELAGFEFPLTPIVVAPKGLFNAGGSTDSVLGYDILRHFVIRLDYKKARMWLRRAPETPMTFLGRDYAVARTGIMPLTESEKAELREDAAQRDREAAERFEQKNATRKFAQTSGGGWVRVEGERLKAGPAPGETWYGFEEMQRIKAERKAGQ